MCAQVTIIYTQVFNYFLLFNKIYNEMRRTCLLVLKQQKPFYFILFTLVYQPL